MFDPHPDLLTFTAPEQTAAAPLSKRAAIKAAGGEAYAALLAKERAANAQFRKRHPGRMSALKRRSRDKIGLTTGRSRSFKGRLCANARKRGRKRGMQATITPADLHWPTHCPVLGIELKYPEYAGERGGQHVQPNWPSLDRFDSAKGYVPGNVYVISCRANTLKNNATYEEILKVAKYLARRPRHG